MVNVELKLYIGTTEYGTIGNPVNFANGVAGTIVEHPLNPFYLWNDKGGVLNSVPASSLVIEVLDMWIEDENMGTSDGTANQTFTSDVFPIVDNSEASEIVVKVGTTTWTRVGSLVGQVGTAQVYTINPTTGVVAFGNGVEGAIPTNGLVIYLTYMPETLPYGKDVYEDTWLEVKSLGTTLNQVNVVDEQQISIDTTHVMVANTEVTVATGVWLSTDTGHTGTNYYTGGSYDSTTGIFTLGTPLPSANTPVLINYTYQMRDDLESTYTPIGKNTSHSFTYPIPQNNAKLLYFRLNVPATATSSGGSNVNFRIRVTYNQ